MARVEPLNISAHSGFMQPRLSAVEEDGEIVDVAIEFPHDFPQQMLEYERNYSFLPNDN